MALPDFVQNNTLTPAGEQVKAHIEAQIAAADALTESKHDLGFINGLPGHLKHYYVHVLTMRSITPAQWLKEQSYAASSVWNELENARHLTEEAAVTTTAQADLAIRLDKLESSLAALAAKLTAPAEPVQPAKKAKPAKAEGDTPAVTPGEGAVPTDEETPESE